MRYDKRGKKDYSSTNKYILVSFLIILSLIMLVAILSKVSWKPTCGDGTLYEECSEIKPYFCSEGILIEKASICGCSDVLEINGDSCLSKYNKNPKNITLDYILRGEEKQLEFIVYEGMNNYISNLSRTISYHGEEEPSRADFKIKNIEEPEQRELLLPLVVKIQNLAKDKRDQVRIATSLVQKIPYNDSIVGTASLGNGQKLNRTRYLYETLYDVQGACEGKSELLAFLLKELGYGTVLFYYPTEDHEAVGIKCPEKYSVKETGYCFIETTGPSIISNDQVYYIEIGKLSSEPEVLFISEGDSFENAYEFSDAKSLIKIGNAIETKGKLNFFQARKLENLREKYGLEYI